MSCFFLLALTALPNLCWLIPTSIYSSIFTPVCAGLMVKHMLNLSKTPAQWPALQNNTTLGCSHPLPRATIFSCSFFFFFSNLVLLRYQPIIFHPTGLQATILQNCFHFNPLLQSQTLTSVSDSTDHSGGWKHSILLAFMTPLPTGCQSTSRATLHLDGLSWSLFLLTSKWRLSPAPLPV